MYRLRPLSAVDLPHVCRHREAMFRDSGRPEDLLEVMREPFRDWVEPRIADGRYFGWMIEAEGEIVAGLGMMEIDWPPHPLHPTDARRGYILNVYVEPSHRHRGLATRLMTAADEEARRRGLGYAILHATQQGRPLYEKLGWQPTAEMAIVI
jgi:GNAT superfamily N-acetyltransferase